MASDKMIYIAACLGPFGQPIGAYKIGCSTSYTKRVEQLTSTLPFTLEVVAAVPGGFLLESICHLHLREHRIRGEYFRVNEVTDALVRRAAETGQAFRTIRDSGFSGEGLDVEKRRKLHAAFMAYHGVTVEEAALFLGWVPARYKDRDKAVLNTKVLAAAAIIAQRRSPVQHINWPDSAIHGLLGAVHPLVQRKRLAAPNTGKVAA